MEAALDIDLGHDVSLPQLSLAVDADSLASWFGQALPALLAPPRCQLEVQLADGAHALQLVREGAVFGGVADDGAGEAAAGTTASALGLMRYVCVATPAFAGHWFGDGFSAEAVALAPAVVSERKLLARYLGQEWNITAPFPHHTLPVSPALDGCISSGVAYGLMPALQAAGPLAAGSLVDLTPGKTYDVALAWHAWNIDTPFTRALSEHIIATARASLPQQ